MELFFLSFSISFSLYFYISLIIVSQRYKDVNLFSCHHRHFGNLQKIHSTFSRQLSDGLEFLVFSGHLQTRREGLDNSYGA